jgi:hypothetical protein
MSFHFKIFSGKNFPFHGNNFSILKILWPAGSTACLAVPSQKSIIVTLVSSFKVFKSFFEIESLQLLSDNVSVSDEISSRVSGDRCYDWF